MKLSSLNITAYNFLRVSAGLFLILNSVHRISNPHTALIYMPSSIFSYFPLSDIAVVLIVMTTSLTCAALILLDYHTAMASGLIASGILFVVLMLLVQTPYLGGGSANKNMFFFDVAMRDFGLIALFVGLALMAIKRKEEAETSLEKL